MEHKKKSITKSRCKKIRDIKISIILFGDIISLLFLGDKNLYVLREPLILSQICPKNNVSK